MDIVVWLRSLGLGKYEAAFRENDIDEAVLPSLTHETLKDLGVASVGHRLKLLEAIAARRNDASGNAPSVDAATTSSAPSAHPECELAAQFLALAEKQKATVPLMIAHRVIGFSLMATGEIAQGRTRFDQPIALYDPATHRSLGTLFEADARATVLCFQSLALWMLGYPEAALANAHYALNDAREIGQATTLMFALNVSAFPLIHCGDYEAASAQLDEAVALTDEKGAAHWKAEAIVLQGCVFALTGKASNAIEMINSGLSAYRSTGTTLRMPEYLSHLARAYADIGHFGEAWRCIAEALGAVETVKEKWYEAETNRIAGEIALQSPERNPAKTEAYFERALAVARQQQAKSWELRAAMSLARLWRDQGKVSEAGELLAPV